LEAVGLTFLLPIIDIAQKGGAAAQNAEGVVGAFVTVYDFFGIPFTLEFMLLGVALVMVLRYTSSFVASWFSAKLRMEYEGHLKDQAFTKAINAEIAYYDREGSDDILNAVITQTRFAGRVIRRILKFFQESLLAVMYLVIALVLAPVLTLLASISLGAITYLIRKVIEPGYTVGDRVADANEQIQQRVQAGTQGIRDVKLFRMDSEVLSEFRTHLRQYVNSNIDLQRNKAAIASFYELTVAVMLFALIYAAVAMLSLSLATLGVFLFAMFRLVPRVSNLNSQFYNIEGDLPHLVRTHWFVEEVNESQEPGEGTASIPETIDRIVFDDVTFSYETAEEQVLDGISFEVDGGEFVGFVGQSGAGKSTIVSLLARMYEPDSGEITANGTPIEEYDLHEWREQIAMVRQKPHIFNETLRFNLTIGNRDSTDAEIERVAEIAKVTEFLDDLPDGYDSQLGDEGIQLSGGQRQRVALARALLTDAEILVLDEATSDLDSNLENEVQKAVESMEREYTIFAIAHRLSTVQNADRIYSIESGQITETGTHQELIDNNGKYAELYQIQS
jgi:subfamily B ATP-binding cassette protein MsbA